MIVTYRCICLSFSLCDMLWLKFARSKNFSTKAQMLMPSCYLSDLIFSDNNLTLRHSRHSITKLSVTYVTMHLICMTPSCFINGINSSNFNEHFYITHIHANDLLLKRMLSIRICSNQHNFAI